MFTVQFWLIPFHMSITLIYKTIPLTARHGNNTECSNLSLSAFNFLVKETPQYQVLLKKDNLKSFSS